MLAFNNYRTLGLLLLVPLGLTACSDDDDSDNVGDGTEDGSSDSQADPSSTSDANTESGGDTDPTGADTDANDTDPGTDTAGDTSGSDELTIAECIAARDGSLACGIDELSAANTGSFCEYEVAFAGSYGAACVDAAKARWQCVADSSCEDLMSGAAICTDEDAAVMTACAE